MFNFSSTIYPIGLDISDTNVKAVQLKKRGKKIKIQAVSRVDLPLGIVQNGEVLKKEIFIKCLQNLFIKPIFGSFHGDDVITCTPELKSYLELIPIEKSPNQLKDMVEAETEKYFPIPLNEMYYDWQIIDEDKSCHNILVGSSAKKTIDNYIDVLTDAKLSIQAIEVESISICRSLLAEEGVNPKKINKNYAIIDIGALRTNLIIYSKNSIILSISLPISGIEITEKISKTLEIRPDQAEKAKIVCGLDKDIAKGIIRNILTENIGNLITKINDGLNFYANKFQDRGPINEVILCGGGANIIGIEEIISEALKLPTKKGNVMTNISSENAEEISKKLNITHKLDSNGLSTSGQEVTIIQSDILSYSTSIGLALRNISLEK